MSIVPPCKSAVWVVQYTLQSLQTKLATFKRNKASGTQ